MSRRAEELDLFAPPAPAAPLTASDPYLTRLFPPHGPFCYACLRFTPVGTPTDGVCPRPTCGAPLTNTWGRR